MCSPFSTRLILACVAALRTNDQQQQQVNPHDSAAARQIHFGLRCRPSWLHQKAKGILSHSDTFPAVTDVADRASSARFFGLRAQLPGSNRTSWAIGSSCRDPRSDLRIENEDSRGTVTFQAKGPTVIQVGVLLNLLFCYWCGRGDLNPQ